MSHLLGFCSMEDLLVWDILVEGLFPYGWYTTTILAFYMLEATIMAKIHKNIFLQCTVEPDKTKLPS